MSYTLRATLSFGTSKTGLSDLRAQLFDGDGANSGSPISTGFTEIGSGVYHWKATITSGFVGGAKFYSAAASSVILGATTISPAEYEYVDAAISSRSTLAAGAEMGLVDDAITAAKFDESTAFPLKSADTGSTQVARKGADADTLETLSDQLDAIGAGIAGTGSSSLVYTVTNVDTGLPIADVKVWATTDAPGNNIVAGARTSTLGVCTLYLDPGVYFIWRRHAQYSFTNPDQETVT